MDAPAILFELERQDIISDGVRKEIDRMNEATQQNQYLHQRLKRTCDDKAFMKVCDTVIAVKGNPKMKSLGNDMKSKLTGKFCMCACVISCIHACVHK